MSLFGKKEKQDKSESVAPVVTDGNKNISTASKSSSAGLYPGVLLRPLITEKSTTLNADRQYVFEVAPGANKITIAKAVAASYNVTPLRINIVNVLGKKVRSGRRLAQRKNWKKAIVTIKPEEKIEFYEGV